MASVYVPYWRCDQDHAADVERLSREIEFGRRKLNELVDDYASGLLTREQFGRAKGRVEAKIEACQDGLNKLKPVGALPKQPIGKHETLWGLIPSWRSSGL